MEPQAVARVGGGERDGEGRGGGGEKEEGGMERIGELGGDEEEERERKRKEEVGIEGGERDGMGV